MHTTLGSDGAPPFSSIQEQGDALFATQILKYVYFRDWDHPWMYTIGLLLLRSSSSDPPVPADKQETSERQPHHLDLEYFNTTPATLINY